MLIIWAGHQGRVDGGQISARRFSFRNSRLCRLKTWLWLEAIKN